MNSQKAHSEEANCLIYCPMPYNGRGPSRSCIQIAEHFPEEFTESRLYLPKSRLMLSNINVNSGLPNALNFLPWKYSKHLAKPRLDRLFEHQLRRSNPKDTIVYFWPAPSQKTLNAAKELGFLSVREMINSYTGTAKAILDSAFKIAGLPPTHTISEEDVQREKVELSKYRYVLSSNKEVDASLLQAGVDESHVLKTSFGWSPSRFNQFSDVPKSPVFTAVFVGTIGVRKGVLQLLQAWQLAKIPGQILLVGNLEPDFKLLLDRFAQDTTIKVIPFTNNMEMVYKSSHMFVFPTFEEGGPQVTYEAAGCGLAIITTPMGTGRIIEHARNGLVVAAGDVPSLAEAMTKLFEDDALRSELAERARQDSLNFTYEIVGRERAKMLRSALDRH